MATEKRNIDDLDAVTHVDIDWTNESNAFVEDDNYASSGAGQFALATYLGCDFANITHTPTGFSEFKVRFMDINSDHANDSYHSEIWDDDSSSWVLLEIFDSGFKLPAGVLTTFDYTTEVAAEYAAAADKTAFLNGLQWRLRAAQQLSAPDKPEIGLAWANFSYTYTAGGSGTFSPIGFKYSPQAPVGAAGSISGSPTPKTFQLAPQSPSGSADIVSSVGTIGFQHEVQAPASASAIVADVAPKSFQFAVVSPVGAAGPVSGAPSPVGFQFDVKAIVSTSAIVVSVSPKTFQKEVKAPVSSSDATASVSPKTFQVEVVAPVSTSAITADVAPKTFQLEVLAPDSGSAGSQVAPINFNLAAKSSVGSASATASAAAIAFTFEVKSPAGSAGITVNVAVTEFKVTVKAPVSTSAITADVAPKAFQLEVLTPDSGAAGSQVAPINFNFISKVPVGSAVITVAVAPKSFQCSVIAPEGSGSGVPDIKITVTPQESLASIGFIPGLSEQIGSRGFIQTGYQMEYAVSGCQLDLLSELNRINLLTKSDQMKFLLQAYLLEAD